MKRFFSNVYSIPQIKRFYKQVTVEKIDQKRYKVRLDGKDIVTGLKNSLWFNSWQNALMVAYQFQQQNDIINLSLMPLFKLHCMAMDFQVEKQLRYKYQEMTIKYLMTDTVLFPAEKGSRLEQKQNQIWTPYIKRFQTKYGCEMKQSYSFAVPDNRVPEQLIGRVKGLTSWQLLGYETVVSNLKSMIIGDSLCELGGVGRHVQAALLQQQFVVEQQWMRRTEVQVMVGAGFLLYKLN